MLFDVSYPQVVAIHQRVVAAMGAATLAPLDRALAAPTVAARQVHAEAVRDVRADGRAGGSRRIRPWKARRLPPEVQSGNWNVRAC